MNQSKDSDISDRESFVLAFQYFMTALRLLSEDAETQCNKMGNYNVAWELKNDVSAGIHLLEHPGGNLSKEQRHAIKLLISELGDIPDEILREAKTDETNYLAMSDSCWVPIRKHALTLIEMFSKH